MAAAAACSSPTAPTRPRRCSTCALQGASDLRQTQLSVGGKVIGYSNGPLIWQRMEWPGAQPQAGATLTIVRNDGRPNPPLTMGGEWGLFRLLQKGAIIDRDPRGRSFSVVWQPAGGERVRIDFRAVGSSNLLLELPLRPALEPPNAITAGGTGCRAGELGLMAGGLVGHGRGHLARQDARRAPTSSASTTAATSALALRRVAAAQPRRAGARRAARGAPCALSVRAERRRRGAVRPASRRAATRPVARSRSRCSSSCRPRSPRRAPHAIARAGAPFVAAARTLFDGLGALDYDALKARGRGARGAGAGRLRRTPSARSPRRSRARRRPTGVERLFRDSADGVAAAALLHRDERRARGRRPRPLVLECPVQETTDALFWLALASRGARGPLSFFWTDVAEPGGEGERRPRRGCCCARRRLPRKPCSTWRRQTQAGQAPGPLRRPALARRPRSATRAEACWKNSWVLGAWPSSSASPS